MSPGYYLLDDDATEDSVFYRLLYDHTAGAAQDLCRAYHGRGSEAYQAIVLLFKSEDVQAWCHDFAQLRDIFYKMLHWINWIVLLSLEPLAGEHPVNVREHPVNVRERPVNFREHSFNIREDE